MLPEALNTDSSLLENLCDHLVEGNSLISFAKQNHFAQKTLYSLIESSDEARKKYVRAREIQAEGMADKIVELADGATPLTANAVRLQVDARKWVAAKLLPKKYGDQPMTNTVQVNVAVISTEKQQALQERRRKLLEE